MIVFDNNSTLLFNSRVSEYLSYAIMKHIYKSKLYFIDPKVCKNIYKKASSSFNDKQMHYNLKQYLSMKPTFKYKLKPIVYNIFDFIDTNYYLDYIHFIHFFDIKKYVEIKMNAIYWSYIDRNIENTIIYRNKKASYDKNIIHLYESISNISDISSLSHLLYLRYKYTLESYFLLHSYIFNFIPVARVKYCISNKSRPCTFGDKCRGGFVFFLVQMCSPTLTYTTEYCFCNKHLSEMKLSYNIQFIV